MSTKGNRGLCRVKQTVLDSFPHSQHRLIFLLSDDAITCITPIPKKMRFQESKRGGLRSNVEIDNKLSHSQANYENFINTIKKTAAKCILKGIRICT